MKEYNEAYVVDMVNLYIRRTFIPESTEYNKIYGVNCYTKTLEEAKELCSECIKAEIKDLQDKLKIVNNYL